MATPKHHGPGEDFFNTKQRNKAIIKKHKKNVPIHEICKDFDLSPHFVDRIVKKFERGNLSFSEVEA